MASLKSTHFQNAVANYVSDDSRTCQTHSWPHLTNDSETYFLFFIQLFWVDSKLDSKRTNPLVFHLSTLKNNCTGSQQSIYKIYVFLCSDRSPFWVNFSKSILTVVSSVRRRHQHWRATTRCSSLDIWQLQMIKFALFGKVIYVAWRN